MADDTLKLLQHRTRQRGASLASISPVAADLADIMDHYNRLHWEDRNRYDQEIRQLKARIAKMEKDEA